MGNGAQDTWQQSADLVGFMAHIGCSPHEALPHVEDAVLVQAQAVGLIGAVYERLDALADVLEQLLKDLPRLLRVARVWQSGS